MGGRLTWGAVTGLASLGLSLLAIALLEPDRPHAASAPPGALELVGDDPLLNRGMNSALALHGRHAYVGSRTDGSHPDAGVLVVDLGDSAEPRVVHQITPPDGSGLGESTRELRVWPEQDLLIVMSFACDPVGHLCVGAEARDAPAEFRFYDLRGEREARPALVATYRPSDNPHEFFLWIDPERRGRALLYVTTPFSSGADIDGADEHLLVTDVSRAREGEFRELVRWSPTREERHDEAGLHSLSLSANGERAYLADLEGGFAMADTADLARGAPDPQVRQLTPPAATVHHESPGAHSAVALPGRPYALITDEVYGAAFGAAQIIGFNVLKGCPWGWSRVIDVGDPAAPREVGEFRVTPHNDPSECASISPVSQNGASFSSHNPTVGEHLALITWHSAGLQVAAIADPIVPERAASFTPEPRAAVVTEDPALSSGTDKVVMWSYPIVRNGLIHVVDLRNGLYVLRYRGPFADELGCRTLLEGNSNAGHPVPACGLDLRLAVRVRRARRGCVAHARLAGSDRGRVRRLDLRGRASGGEPLRVRVPRGRTRLAAVATTADGSRIPLVPRRVRCGQ